MPFSKIQLNILIIEDNPGDFVLIVDYLREKTALLTLQHVTTFSEAEDKLNTKTHFDAILLDLSLPDASGEKLVNDVMLLSGSAPVIVLTGFSDKDFGIKSLSLGVSDYLLKDELDATQLFKSISYGIERKRISIQLNDSEAKYRRLFHFSPIPMWVFDVATFRFLSVNNAAVRNYGYSREEFLSKTASEIWSYKTDEEHVEKLNQMKETVEQYRGVVQHAKKSGELMYVEIQSDEIDFDGRKARLVLATDITEKVRTAKAIELSEQRFKALVQDGSDMIAILNSSGDFTYVSPASESILGITAEELVGKNALKFIHDADQEKVKYDFNLLDHQKSVQTAPFRFRDAENNWRWIETKLTNMVNDPAVGGIVSNSKEVTERIENEIKIRESIERFNIVAKATSDIIWDWDFKTNAIEWNENIKSVLGYNRLQENMATWLERIHKEDISRVEIKLNKSIKALNPYWTDEYRYRCADGSYRYFFDRGFLMTDERGVPSRMIGSMQDITRQKEEEHRLKLLESVITYATDSVIITEATSVNSPEPRIVYVNDAFTHMTGYSKDEAIGKTLSLLHGPKTSMDELDKLRKAMNNWEPCEVEIINYKKNGEQFWMDLAIAPVADNAGVYTHWIAIERDVTERVNYIQRVEDQNQRLKEIAWTQSHVVRAPLSRIMGLIEILPKYESYDKIPKEIFPHILNSARELDGIIRDIVMKTEVIYNSPKE